jgi:signal peptidase
MKNNDSKAGVRKNSGSENKILKTIRIIKNVIFATILVFLVSVLIVTMFARISGQTPSFLGYTIFRVSSGSMKPTLQVGDVILTHSCDVSELQKGDIISYEGTKGEFAGKIVTHRVEQEPYVEGGETYLVTKGDNNPVADSPIRAEDVLGKMVVKLDLLASLYSFFVTPWGLLTILALIFLAFFNEVVVLVKSLMGINQTEKKDSVQDIIDRYAREQKENEILQKVDRQIEPDAKDVQQADAQESEPGEQLQDEEPSSQSSDPSGDEAVPEQTEAETED